MYKLLILFLIPSCASIPVYINKDSTLKMGAIEDTYLIAQQMFVSHTSCTPPKNVSVIIEDTTLSKLNYGHSALSSDGSISVLVGTYESKTRIISIAIEHPDRARVLFHEYLHFMIMESKDCYIFTPEPIQHIIIRSIEKEYFKKTGRVKSIPPDWIYEALKQYGFKE